MVCHNLNFRFEGGSGVLASPGRDERSLRKDAGTSRPFSQPHENVFDVEGESSEKHDQKARAARLKMEQTWPNPKGFRNPPQIARTSD